MQSQVLALRWNILWAATLAVWVTAYVAWTADWLLQPMPFMLERALRRIPVCIAGFGLCLLLIRPLRATAGRPFAQRLGFAVMLCAAGSLVEGAVSETAFYVISPKWGGAAWSHLPVQAMLVFWVFLAWTGLYFAIEYDGEARENRLRLNKAESLAVEARNRALMEQINPHFLFNALNTISGFILEGDGDRAEHTVLSLSKLLRRSLDGDAPPFRTLAEEMEAQVDYLSVQRARFGDRFRFVASIPPELQSCTVPSLILQPLIENAFTHGVAHSQTEVTLEVHAELADGLLTIAVSDNARASRMRTVSAPRAGVGLQNVRSRLAAIYGDDASLVCTRRVSGGYLALLRLPLRRS